MHSFKNKICVITGASSGIGLALAKALHKAGANLALNDINAERLESATSEFISEDSSTLLKAFDVSDKVGMQEFCRDVLDKFGSVDVVFNNAGVALGRFSVEEVSYEDLEWIININLWGVIYGTKVFLPHLMKRPEAALVNISSLFGLAGIAEQAPYCATKFAVRGFTESLRMEMEGSNVSVSSVHPGGIKTNIVRDSRDRSEEARRQTADRFDNKLAQLSPEQAAEIILDGVRKKKARILVGKDAKMGDFLVRLFPGRYHQMMKKRVERMMGNRA